MLKKVVAEMKLQRRIAQSNSASNGCERVERELASVLASNSMVYFWSSFLLAKRLK
ncbi:hypothetical protein HYW99_03010 [Candidatus Woesearchaeota archaeon]|nr:hypothetical protein [Candidatus Woesearchaeota archaeon]